MPLHWYLLYRTPTPTGQESPPLSLHQPAMVAEERGLQSLAMDLCTTLFPFLWCPQLLYLLMEPTMLVTRGKRSADPGYALPFYHVPHVLPAVPVVSGYGINQAHPSGSSYQHFEKVEGYALGK